jgi:hypothetical protein
VADINVGEVLDVVRDDDFLDQSYGPCLLL